MLPVPPHRPSVAPRPAARTLLIALLLIALPACVTTRTTTYGFHGTGPSPGVPRTGTNQAPAKLPDGPLATPVVSQSSHTHLRASLMDLGYVPYDGQVLPLVSPDGRFVAVEQGVAPTWPTILAAPGAEVPHSTRLAAFSLPDPLAANPGKTPPSAQPITWSDSHSGLLLGRSCDADGFLVEAPQPDGSRWIGRIRWLSGELRWLVQGTLVNAYAVLGPAGELAYTRRGIDSTSLELVVRSSQAGGGGADREVVSGVPDGGYLWPMFTDEPGVVYAFALTRGVAELHALKIPQKGDPPLLVVVGRQPVLRDANAATLYQMTAACQIPLPASLTTPRPEGSDKQESGRFDKLLFFHSGQRRMVAFDRRLGVLVALPPDCFAAVPISGTETGAGGSRPGYLVTTDERIEYVPTQDQSDFDRSRGIPVEAEQRVSILTGSYLPRLTTIAAWPAVLIGPGGSATEARIHLFRLRLESADLDTGR